MPRLLPTLAAFAASFLLGAVPFLSVHLYAAGLNPQSLLFLRYWLALTLLIPFAALWCRQKIETAVSQAGLILWIDAAVLGTVQTYCYFEALRRGPSSIAVVGLFCFPPITLAIERMIGRRVELADVGSSAVVLAGAVAAVSPVINGDLHLDGILYAFATPCFYSVYLLIAAPRMRELDPLIATILLYLGLGAGFALIVCTTGLALPHNAQQWGYMAVIAMFGGAIALRSLHLVCHGWDRADTASSPQAKC